MKNSIYLDYPLPSSITDIKKNTQMIKEWLTGKEYMRLTEISESTLKRLRRKTKMESPELLKMEDGKCKLNRDLLRKHAPQYFVNFHEMVNYQLKLGKNINSISSLYGLFLIQEEWTLMGALNDKKVLSSKTCLNKFKRMIEPIIKKYPQTKSFFAIVKNKYGKSRQILHGVWYKRS